jgi:5-methyltetrahydropteroyltriglutamate--homocysteine methyltransferase
MPSPARLVPTTVVGSYPQPEWLIDRGRLSKTVPRVGMSDLWRIPEEQLEAAQNDATRLAIRDLEDAGLDVITDGEIRRESYSNHFILALEGIDLENPGIIRDHRDNETIVPRIVGPIRRRTPVELDSLAFLRANTHKAVKVTLPGPFTLAQQAKDEHYGDVEAVAMGFAAAINAEARDLAEAGADVIQLDEPWLRNDPAAARRFAVPAINRALAGVSATTIVHLCFGYAALVPGQKPTGYEFLGELSESAAQQISIESAQPKLDLGVLRDLTGKTIVLGVLDLGDPDVESPETVAARIRRAFEHVDPSRIVAAPDCGMKYMPRETALGKLRSLAQGAALVRAELA